MSEGKLVIHKRSYNPNNEGHVKSLVEDCIKGEGELTAKRVAQYDKLREQIKLDKECKAQRVKNVEGKSVLIIRKRSHAPDAEVVLEGVIESGKIKVSDEDAFSGIREKVLTINNPS